MSECTEGDIIYIAEDDYLHLPNPQKYLTEGLEVSDYATLYDSLDKYQVGANPYVRDGGEDTKVIITESTHWKYTNATTGTFACKINTLQQDYDVFSKNCNQSVCPHPQDFKIFRELIEQRQRKLINSIPGRSAHIGREMSPFVNWRKIADEFRTKD